MKTFRYFKQIVFALTFASSFCKLSAQDRGVLAQKTGSDNAESQPVKHVKRFSNSESPDVLFDISTNMKDCMVQIITDYPETYKIRFIDYWGKSVKLHRNLNADSMIDVSEFKEQIVIMNIQDSKSNKLLSSQVVNLKRRNYR